MGPGNGAAWRQVLYIAITAAAMSGCLDEGDQLGEQNDTPNDVAADGGDDLISFTSGTANNRPPQIWGTAPEYVEANSEYFFKPTAADPDDDALRYSLANQPQWMNFDRDTGIIRGQPRLADIGYYSDIILQVSDGLLTDVMALNIEVMAADQFVGTATIAWAPPVEHEDGTPLLDLAGFNIYYGTRAGDYPERITVDNPGITRFVVDGLNTGTYYFVTTAFNRLGAESDFSNMVVRTVQ